LIPSSDLTIVSYHYVRPHRADGGLASRALSLASFRHQLDHIGRHYAVVTAEAVIAASCDNGALPPRAIWLTFDDGYRDHYQYVLPELVARGWQGSFFPVGCAIDGAELLDVNRIHFILVNAPSVDALVAEIRQALDRAGRAGSPGIDGWQVYWKRFATPYRFDCAKTMFVKRLLQHGLPEQLRRRVLQGLFVKFVGTDPSELARELYMNRAELKQVRAAGMFIGSHGWSHRRLPTLSASDRECEIDRSRTLIGELGANPACWVMAYPHGEVDDVVERSLQQKGCRLGLTIRPEVAHLRTGNVLRLPRLDANHLPTLPRQTDSVAS